MADSYRQQRLKELQAGNNDAGVNSADKNIPYRQRRLMELGFLPDSRPSTQLLKNLPSPLQSGFGGLQNTTLGQAAAGNPAALKTYKDATGIQIQPNSEKVRAQRQSDEDDQRARDFFGPTITDNFLIPFTNFVDNSILGKAASRTSLSAANALNLYPDDQRALAINRPSTGSKVADTALDITGAIGGYTSNPAGVGVAGQSLLSGPYRAADNFLATRAGTALQNKVAAPFSRIVSTPTANTIANQALRGGSAGALQGVAQSAIQGDASAGNVLQNAALGAGLGAAGDVLISGLGSFIRSRVGNRSPFTASEAAPSASSVETTPTALDTPATAPAPKSGIVSAYDNLPVFMRRNLSPEDVTRLKNTPYGYNFDTTNNGVLSLPPGNARGATVARSATLENPYRTRFENLIKEAQQNPAVKNVNDLEQYWASIAGKEDPNLDTLIDLAYPPTKPNRVTSDLLQKAKTNQAQREVYGVPLPVRSASERINAPSVTGQAMLSSRTGVTGGSLPERIGGNTRNGLMPTTSAQAAEQAVNNPTLAANARGVTSEAEQAINPPRRIEDVTPTGEPIIKPDAEINGLGIQPFQRVGKYDNLSTTTKSQLVSRQKREPRQLGKLGQRLYTNLVDDLNPVNNFTKYANEILDDTITADKDPYRQALTSRGSDMIAKQITTDAFVDQNGNVVGQSLKDAIKEVPYKDYVSFEDYLINKHAIIRHDRGEKVFADEIQWTPEKGAQIIADYERMFPMFKEASENVYQYNQNLVQHWLVDTGMISQKQADAYFAANPYYVPNKRYFTSLEKGGRGFSKSKDGFGNQSNPVKKLAKGGSQRQIISPIESMIENTDAFVKAANRNKVMQNFVDVIEQDADDFKDFAEIVDDTKAARKLDVQKELTNPESEDAVADLIQEATTDFQKYEQSSTFKRTKLDKDNIVRAMINGEPTYVKFNDPDLLNAMLAIGPESSTFLLRVAGRVTNFLKSFTTGRNPFFAIGRSLVRDIPQAYVQSKTTNNPISFAVDLFTAAYDIARQTEGFKHYERLGGGHSSSLADNRNMLARSKSAVLPKTIKDLPGIAFRSYEDALNIVEAVPRLSEFKRSQKLGNSWQQAIFDANEITVNFKRRGVLSKELDKVFPYWNAAIQGLDKSARTFRDNPTAALTKTFLAITLPTFVLYAVNHNDPNYQKLSDRIKDNFFLIPKPDGTFWKVAKPQELGTIFSDIPERLLRKFREDDPEGFRDFAEQLRTNFLPPGVSGFFRKGDITDKLFTGVIGDTIAGPLANINANKDFADRPIVPAYLERLSPEFQSDARTSSLGKWIGEQTNSSPKKIDYLIRQYTGFVGQIGLPALSPANSGKNIFESIGNSFNQTVTTDSVFSSDLSTDFYRYKDQLDQANIDKEFKPLPDWYSNSARKKLDRLSDDMSKIRKKMREVEGNTTIKPEDKRQKLRDFQQQINEVAEKGNEYAKEKNIPYK
ncbi:LPD38 domain-containing protein [Paenibacillus kandeliae]|uniref:LPD38 domain-containing protein n=1 Tax=Paenibacillus kandeliae TaxID=3231269 RepID=UPI0034597BC2